MNACPDLLAALKQRLHDLELEKARAYARATEVQDLIDMIEQLQRRRRRMHRGHRSRPSTSQALLTSRSPAAPDELFPDPQDTPESAQQQYPTTSRNLADKAAGYAHRNEAIPPPCTAASLAMELLKLADLATRMERLAVVHEPARAYADAE